MLSVSPEKNTGKRREGRNKHFHSIVIDRVPRTQNQKPPRNNSPDRNLDHFRLLLMRQ